MEVCLQVWLPAPSTAQTVKEYFAAGEVTVPLKVPFGAKMTFNGGKPPIVPSVK